MKVIIFDFNGTIIDDLALCHDILNKMLVEEGKDPITMERYKEIFTFPIIDYYKEAGFDFVNTSFHDLSVRFIEYYQKASLNCPLHEGFLETAKLLKQNGYSLVVLSASQIDNLKEQLAHFRILDLFDAVLGIDNIYAKSKTAIGVSYMQEHNLNPKDVIMLGDTLHDKETADTMGIKSVLYSKGHQSKDRLLKANTYVVDSYAEFREKVLSGELYY